MGRQRGGDKTSKEETTVHKADVSPPLRHVQHPDKQAFSEKLVI
jgi:hypothetical protein